MADHEHHHHEHECCEHEHQHVGRLDRMTEWAEREILLVLGAFMAFSYFSGRIRCFVARYYVWLCPVAAVVLFAMWISRIRARGHGCGCEHDGDQWHMPRSVCVFSLAVPLVMVLLVNPRTFTPEGFRKRRSPRPQYAAKDPELRRAMDWVLGLRKTRKKGTDQAASLPKNPTLADLLNATEEGATNDIQGQFVTVVGQCDLPQGPKSERFDLYRLLVTCCIADATAISVEVVRKATVPLDSGRWISISGIIRFDSALDPSMPVIHAAKIAKIQEPSDPYL